MRFDWDERKNRTNTRKHGIRFQDATRVFEDPDLWEIPQVDLYDEERWIAFGRTDPGRMSILMVVFTDRPANVRRIISARLATPRETNDYYARLDRV